VITPCGESNSKDWNVTFLCRQIPQKIINIGSKVPTCIQKETRYIRTKIHLKET